MRFFKGSCRYDVKLDGSEDHTNVNRIPVSETQTVNPSDADYGSTTIISTFTGRTKNFLFNDYNSVLDKKIKIPEAKNYNFSLKKLWAFSGPGFLMSIAYLDPGNIEADLKAGCDSIYDMLWILLWATAIGLFIQRLAARIGSVTGEDMAETCRKRFTTVPRILLWLMLEVTIIASDMQEVIGTSIALYLLSNKGIPLYAGVVLTIVDTFTFLFLDKYGIRKLEAFFAFLIAIMAITFGYEYVAMHPNQMEVLKGLFIPGCSDYDSKRLLQGVGIVGALITPHNLYLHSSLVKSREINRKIKAEVRDANRYYFIEAAIALLMSLVINIFVLSVFAAGMHGMTNTHVLHMCSGRGLNTSDVFKDDNSLVEGDMYRGGIFLGCEFGAAYMYIFAVGLLAAGQSSTMTGTYTGQFVMEGFLRIKWKRWKRVLLTRTLAICPTVLVALLQDVNHMSGMNEFLNALMSLQLPFAMLVTFMFSSSEKLMGEFANDRKNNVFMGIVSVSLIGLNIFFAANFVGNQFPHTWPVYICFGIFMAFYVTVLGFLALCLMVVLGFKRLTRMPILGSYLEEKYQEKEVDNKIEVRKEIK